MYASTTEKAQIQMSISSISQRGIFSFEKIILFIVNQMPKIKINLPPTNSRKILHPKKFCYSLVIIYKFALSYLFLSG